MTEVYLSFSGQDRATAEQLKSILNSRGISVQGPADEFAASMDFRAATSAAIGAAAVVVVLWTPRSVYSKYILAEAAEAQRQGKLFCVRSDDFPASEIPAPFRTEPIFSVEELQAFLASSSVSSGNPLLDAVYRARIVKDDVPPTLGQAPIAETPAAPSHAPSPQAEYPAPVQAEHPMPAVPASPGVASTRNQSPARPARPEGVGAASDDNLGRYLSRFPMGSDPRFRVGAVKPATQEQRDALYRERTSHDDVPRTLGSAPIPAAGMAGALNDRLSLQKLRSWADLRRQMFEPAGLPPGTSQMFQTSEMTATKAKGNHGLLLVLLLAAIASLPLLSQSVRGTMSELIAALGLKLNAFWFLGLLSRGKATPQTDMVDCSVFSPPAAPAGATILVQVFLHVPQHAERAKFTATMMDQTTAIKGVQSLQTPIGSGARVDVTLSEPNLAIEEPSQSLTWRGEPTFCQFLVTLPESAAGKSFHPVIRLSVDGGLVGRIAFRIAANAEATAPQSAPSGDMAHRYRHAFLSYATADRKEVLKRAQVLQAAGVSFFHDLLTLDPGDRWEKEIFRNIDRCDLFLLFWSEAAKGSEYVLKEAEYALARRKDGDVPDIVPVILEGPPPVLPPASLKDIHFNDRIQYLIAAH